MVGYYRSSASVLADIDALRGILDSIPHPVFVKDEESRFLLMNETMCRLMGHSFEDIVGKQDEDFVPKNQAETGRTTLLSSALVS